MDQNSELYKDLDRVLLTREEIAAKVRELGQQITRDYAGKEPVLVCILKGAAVFFTDLIREIDLPISLDFMAISSYGSATKTSATDPHCVRPARSRRRFWWSGGRTGPPPPRCR